MNNLKVGDKVKFLLTQYELEANKIPNFDIIVGAKCETKNNASTIFKKTKVLLLKLLYIKEKIGTQ